MSTTTITAESRLSKLRDDMLNEADELDAKADRLHDKANRISMEGEARWRQLNFDSIVVFTKAEAFREAVAMVEEALSQPDMTL